MILNFLASCRSDLQSKLLNLPQEISSSSVSDSETQEESTNKDNFSIQLGLASYLEASAQDLFAEKQPSKIFLAEWSILNSDNISIWLSQREDWKNLFSSLGGEVSWPEEFFDDYENFLKEMLSILKDENLVSESQQSQSLYLDERNSSSQSSLERIAFLLEKNPKPSKFLNIIFSKLWDPPINLARFFNLDSLKSTQSIEIPDEFRKILDFTIREYPKSLTAPQKIRIIAEILKLDVKNKTPDQINAERALIFLKNTGPVMQKLGQLLSYATPDQDLKKALSKLLTQDNMDEEFKTAKALEAKEKIESMLNSKGLNFSNVFQDDPKFVSMGSIGYVVQLKSVKGEEIFVKLVRSDTLAFYQEEKIFFDQLKSQFGTENFSMEILTKRISKIQEEFDLTKEKAYIEQAKNFYQGKNVTPVELFSNDKISSNEELLFLKKAPGKSLKEDLETMKENSNFEKRKLAIEEFYRMWIRKSLFPKEGEKSFFHSDPHSGNLFYDQASGKMTVIDFGSSGSLEPQEIRAFKNILKGAVQFVLGFEKAATDNFILAARDMDKGIDDNKINQFKNLIKNDFEDIKTIEKIMNSAEIKNIRKQKLSFNSLQLETSSRLQDIYNELPLNRKDSWTFESSAKAWLSGDRLLPIYQVFESYQKSQINMSGEAFSWFDGQTKSLLIVQDFNEKARTSNKKISIASIAAYEVVKGFFSVPNIKIPTPSKTQTSSPSAPKRNGSKIIPADVVSPVPKSISIPRSR